MQTQEFCAHFIICLAPPNFASFPPDSCFVSGCCLTSSAMVWAPLNINPGTMDVPLLATEASTAAIEAQLEDSKSFGHHTRSREVIQEVEETEC